MTNTGIRIIKLNCVNCGSSLDISQQMERLACGYCGTQQIVERSGGAIHLRGVAEALAKVQTGTDKTAAELALARLSKELEAARYQRAATEEKWMNYRTQKLYEWNAFLEHKKNTVTSTTLVAGVIALFPSVMVAAMVSNILSALGGIAMLASAIVLIGMPIGAALFIRNLMQQSDKYNLEKLQDGCNREFSALDSQIAKALGEIDKRIANLNTKIQQNYQIANA